MLFFVLFCFVSSIFVHVFDKLITWRAAINSNLTFPASHMLTCCILTLLEGNKTKGAVQHARTFHGKWNCSFLSLSPRRPIIKLWWLTADSCQSLNQEKVSVWYVSYYSGGKKNVTWSLPCICHILHEESMLIQFLSVQLPTSHTLPFALAMFSGPGWMFQHPCHTFKNTSIKFCVFFFSFFFNNEELQLAFFSSLTFFIHTNFFL